MTTLLIMTADQKQDLAHMIWCLMTTMIIISMITHIPISQDGFDNGEPDEPNARGEHDHLPHALVKTCPTW